MHELVAQFLAHDGYVETARAFAEEVASESAALHGRGESLKKYEVEEDLEAINRQSEYLWPVPVEFHIYIYILSLHLING